MDWGIAHGDPLKFYSLPHEAKVAFLAANLVFGEEVNKRKKAKKVNASTIPPRFKDLLEFQED